MPMLTDADRRFLDENGYLVVPDVVPVQDCEAVIEALFSFLDMDANNPEDWYRLPLKPGGMVEIYQHQALWNNRQNPRMHALFTDIYGSERLHVTIDRAGFKPPFNPAHPEYDHKGFIHWDMNTTKPPQRLGLQGVLCLTDTDRDQGGFQCVPRLFREFEEWAKTQPVDRNPSAPDLTGFDVEPIAAQAGDLIIWNRMLAHGNGHNVSDQPRLAQYIAMFEAEPETAGSEGWGGGRETRIREWRERLSPDAAWAPGDPRGWERKHGKTAELTPLGRKLLGLDLWE